MVTIQNEKQHLAASCLVLNKDKTKALVIYHKKLQKWLIPGGHVEVHEAPHEAALRETKEETGVDASLILSKQSPVTSSSDTEASLPLPVAIFRESIPANQRIAAHYHIDFIYLAEAQEEALNAALHEVDEARWVTKNELMKLDTFESIRQLAERVLV